MTERTWNACVEQARHKRRISALAAAALMLLSVILFAAVVLREAHHDCTGAECSVCACVQDAARRLMGGGDAAPATELLGLYPFFAFVLCLLLLPSPAPLETPVSLRVKLLN